MEMIHEVCVHVSFGTWNGPDFWSKIKAKNNQKQTNSNSTRIEWYNLGKHGALLLGLPLYPFGTLISMDLNGQVNQSGNMRLLRNLTGTEQWTHQGPKNEGTLVTSPETIRYRMLKTCSFFPRTEQTLKKLFKILLSWYSKEFETTSILFTVRQTWLHASSSFLTMIPVRSQWGFYTWHDVMLKQCGKKNMAQCER